MKNILYIGNKLEKHGLAPTTADTLPQLLRLEDFNIKAVSSVKNKTGRLVHMIMEIFMRRKKTDLVLIDTYSTTNFWYAVICGYCCSILKVSYIFILHGGKLDRRFKKSSSAIMNIFRKAEKNIAPSEYLVEKLDPYLENIQIIPNWIALQSYNFRHRKDIEPRLVWVRAFDEVYNPVLALDVLEQLLKRYPDAELLMVGPEKDGSLMKCKDIARKKNLPVTFTGKLSKEEWTSKAEEYDIFINTTLVDNTPVSVIEAMALGLPVVSTKVGGIPYLIESGKNGIVVEPDNAVAMADAVFNLLNDEELSGSISSKARESAEKYDWEQVKPLWLELLS